MKIKIQELFNFRHTILSHGFYQTPPFFWDGEKDTLHIAIGTSNGKPVHVKVTEAKGGVKVLSTNGAIEKSCADTIRKTVVRCLMIDEDFSGFYDFCKDEKRLKPVIENGMGRMLRSPTLFEDIVKSICGTNTQWKQAVKMIAAIGELGQRAEKSYMRTFPSPEVICDAGSVWLRERARVGYRAEYITALCESVIHGDIDLESVENGEVRGAELNKFFLSIKGIGKATTPYLKMLSCDYSDIVVDSATHAVMKKIHGKKLTDKQIERRYKKYGKWKALVLWYDWYHASGGATA